MTTPGDAILTALQANTVCTALVYGGAAGMIDAGKLTVPWLSAQEDARKAAESTAILAVIVRDGGEVAGTNNISHVYVGLYDRKQGNTKLKPAMQQVIYAVTHAKNVTLPSVQKMMMTPLTIGYAARSGFVTDTKWHIQLVEIQFDVSVYYEETY